MKIRFNNLLNNLKISKKLLLMYSCTSLIPLFLIGLYLSIYNKNLAIDKDISDAISTVNTLNDNLKKLVDLSNYTSSTIYFDDSFKNTAIKKYDSFAELVKEYSKPLISDTFVKYYNDLKHINFYVENETLVNNKYFIKIDDSIRSKPWYNEAIINNGRAKWIYKKNIVNDDYDLSLIRLVKNSASKAIGILDITLNNESLNLLVDNIVPTTFITLEDDVPIISNDKTLLNDKINFSSVELVETYDNIEIFKGKLDNSTVQILKKKIVPDMSSLSEFNLYVVLNLSETSREYYLIAFKSVYIIFFSFIISLMLIIIFTRLFNNRFSILSREMNKVAKGNFDILDSLNGNDEISELYNDLSSMSTSLETLIQEVYVENLNKEKMTRYQKEIEFKMLSNQINPHFLYNTLETIRMRSYCNGDKETSNLIKVLGKLIRRNLEINSSLVSLDSEIELTENYLTIQKYRFGEKHSFSLNITTDTRDILILPMLIQPIVENAFIHGLQGKISTGFININIEILNQKLIVSVSDNGPGISKKKLSDLLNKFNLSEDDNGNHIGMSNVYRRIKLFYGDDYGITIKSTPHGTSVILTLKIIKEEDS